MPMSNDPLFSEPGLSEKLAKDPQVMAMAARAQTIRIVTGLILLVVLGAILLMSVFK
jgi:hypothetical protein